ncbi:MAG: Dihydrolipoyl dehydrogenase [Planctomycetes bacterium ADurb.Bin412]|nr:MAG: Dihydrolipoyl dehydrogenase [Planctomycetes bacterium ADurb.Bin412]
MAEKYDSIVIGAGPGGYVTALRLAGKKQKVAVVEAKELGGTCLNRGCIPTKTLLHSSEIVASVKHGKEHGITAENLKVDLAAMIQRKNQVVAKLRGGVAGLLKGRKVDVYAGKGKLLDKNKVEVKLNDGKTAVLETNNIIIATGSAATMPGFFPQDRSKVMTSDEILDLEKLPESLLIVGGGYIGCEFATVFAELGTKVIVVEMLDRLISMADKDLSDGLAKTFKKMGIEVLCGTAVEKMEVTKSGVKTTVKGGQVFDTTLALVCTGRRPMSEDLGLEKVGVVMEKGFIKIDEQCRTNIPNIFAIGDVTGKVQLAHVASRQGAVVTNVLTGTADREDYSIVPTAIYTHPEIGSVGLTEQQAKDKGIKIKTAKFQMMASGMALAYGETSGFVKLIANEEDDIIGAHLMCPHASDLVQEIAVLMKAECTLHELAATIHGHPTFAESLAEATEILLGNPLHGH